MSKIMIVEDDTSLREIYGIRMTAEGYEVVSAGDGEEALAMAVKEKPDLILSDVMMPKISGFDMLDILKSTPETKDIKVVMMTALSSEDQRARGERLGADRYLVKSQVGIEDVVNTIHEVLGDKVAATSQPAASTTQPATPTTQPVAPTPQPAAPTTPPASQMVSPAVQSPTPVSAPAPAPVSTINPTPAANAAPVAVSAPTSVKTPTAPQTTANPQTAPAQSVAQNA